MSSGTALHSERPRPRDRDDLWRWPRARRRPPVLTQKPAHAWRVDASNTRDQPGPTSPGCQSREVRVQVLAQAQRKEGACSPGQLPVDAAVNEAHLNYPRPSTNEHSVFATRGAYVHDRSEEARGPRWLVLRAEPITFASECGSEGGRPHQFPSPASPCIPPQPAPMVSAAIRPTSCDALGGKVTRSARMACLMGERLIGDLGSFQAFRADVCSFLHDTLAHLPQMRVRQRHEADPPSPPGCTRFRVSKSPRASSPSAPMAPPPADTTRRLDAKPLLANLTAPESTCLVT